MTRPTHATPDRYEGPLPAELAAMSSCDIAVALLDIVHDIDEALAIYADSPRFCGRSVPEALYARRRWLTEAARRIRG